ncbi:trypsin-like serine peptidase [Streptomyces fildesensis]|uniref:Serine protease n=1 Tax=Streptomyces fildesensis TaxID=375757 RepID=A0ABW8CJK0_9ACTN
MRVTKLISDKPDQRGRLKVQLANGRTVDIPASSKDAVLKRSSENSKKLSPDTTLPGNCGVSQVEVGVKDDDHPVRMTTGFAVDTPAVEYGWTVDITGPKYSYHYTAEGFLAGQSTWNGSHDSDKDYTAGDYTATVTTASYALLATGVICYSAGPVAKEAVTSPDAPIGVRLLADGGTHPAVKDAALSRHEMSPAAADPTTMTPVADATQFPYTAVVRLDVTFPSNAFGSCTGFMYDERTVATAGHCLYNEAEGGWAKVVFALPGKSGPGMPFGICEGVALYSVDGFVLDDKSDYDYGAVRLEDQCATVGNRTGWFGLSFPDSQNDAPPSPVTVTGYNPSFSGMSTGTGSVESHTDRHFDYDVTTNNGVSGSPVYADGCDGYCAVGIHRSTVGGIARATRITQASVEDFDVWATGAVSP